MLMVLAHGVDESIVKQITEAFPKGKDGKEVDPSPFIKPSRKLAQKVHEYLVERKKRLALEVANTARASEEAVETSTAAASAHTAEP